MKQAKTSDTAAVESTPETPVVGIGASAGGLEAFTRLLGKLQSNTGLAYVLLQHLDPEHKSELPEILGRAANMPVIAAADGMAIEPDHVYVIPPGTATTVLDGHLRVVERERARGVLTLIDAFFLSLAEAQGGVATAVILSGAGSDGSRGIAAIKERGGITIAQDPGSAEFPSMPESAIATGCVDFVMPPEQIADQLLSIGRVESIREAQTGHSHAGQTRAGQAHPGQAHESPVEVTDTVQADIERILILLMRRTGADFRQYRGATVRRRILRRMIAHGSAQYREYLDRVRADPAELDLLGQDILIGVTQFFRDPEAFVAMQQMALPEVLRGLVPGAPVRIWVAGCSSGQEAYSMAILAFEYLSERGLGNRIQIFATDLNEAAIIRARAGLYPHSIERDVTPERLARFFVREDEGYRVTRQVRDLCVFAKHNLLQDPPFSQLDIITCRNVLIYLDAAPQERTMEIFQYALRDTGTLMLGGAESADATYFLPLDKRHRLYRRLPRTPRPLGSTIGVPAPPVLARRLSHGDSLQRLKPSTSQIIAQDADRAVLARLAPPGVVVNSKLEVVQFRGETSPFLQHSPGAASLHLLRLVRPEFLPWLRSAIDRAGLEATVVRHDDVTFHDGELVRRIAIDVIPFVSGGAEERYFAILFYGDFSQPVHPATESAEGTGKAQRRLVSPVSGPDASREIARLVEELSDTKRYLQDVIEQYEAANEELRAAGEEIQSSNEELRS
ncbi:MAG: chemotaxis protein CheB, partial [Gemmatimonadaceae bacterium]